MPCEHDLPCVRAQRAGKLVDEGGFAGAVRTNERVYLSAPHVKIDVVGSDQSAEMLVQLPDLQQRVSHRERSCPATAARRGLRFPWAHTERRPTARSRARAANERCAMTTPLPES